MNEQSECGSSLFGRICNRPDISNIDEDIFPDGIKAPQIIEINGKEGTGKSFLCLHLLACCLLPIEWRGLKIGGCGVSAVYIDTDGHFNILQFANMMEVKIRRIIRSVKEYYKTKGESSSKPTSILDSKEILVFLKLDKSEQKKHINSLVESCLDNLIFMRCTDSFQFSVTLLSIDEVILRREEISLIIIDCISSFYWYDRVHRSESWLQAEMYYNKIFKILFQIIKKYKLSLIGTKQDLFSKKRISFDNVEEDAVPTAYEYMGKEWSKNINYKINLSISDLPKFDQKQLYKADIESKNVVRSLNFVYQEDGVQSIKLI